jgi:hypothetical protein
MGDTFLSGQVSGILGNELIHRAERSALLALVSLLLAFLLVILGVAGLLIDRRAALFRYVS